MNDTAYCAKDGGLSTVVYVERITEHNDGAHAVSGRLACGHAVSFVGAAELWPLAGPMVGGNRVPRRSVEQMASDAARSFGVDALSEAERDELAAILREASP